MDKAIQTKRLLSEYKSLTKEPIENIDICLDEEDTSIIYFLIYNLPFPYEQGAYIGRLKFEKNYPMTPPSIQMLTPNGRFSINQNICLTNSSYHPETWNPCWTIRTILVGFASVMLDDTIHGVAHISTTTDERIKLAKESININLDFYPFISVKFSFYYN
jgi:ubiquitin-conjugating enzyme E2 J2